MTDPWPNDPFFDMPVPVSCCRPDPKHPGWFYCSSADCAEGPGHRGPASQIAVGLRPFRRACDLRIT